MSKIKIHKRKKFIEGDILSGIGDGFGYGHILWTFIYREDDDYNKIGTYCSCCSDGYFDNGCSNSVMNRHMYFDKKNITNLRYATDEECNTLIEKIKNERDNNKKLTEVMNFYLEMII